MKPPLKLSAIVFLDIEASGLQPGCFPIEVGYVHAHDLTARSVLVRPEVSWLEDGIWDEVAEELHGVSLDQLAREGESADSVAAMLNTALVGKAVFSDAPGFDRHWLEMLFAESPWSMGFELLSADWLFREWRDIVKIGSFTPVTIVDMENSHSHRAAGDACVLAKKFSKLIRP